MYGYRIKNNDTGQVGFICSDNVKFEGSAEAVVIVLYEDETDFVFEYLSDLSVVRIPKEKEEGGGGVTFLSLVPGGDDDDPTTH